MITKLFTAESKTVTGAAIIIGLSTLASRVIGLLRDRVFAHYFGAGHLMDAYYASFKIPDLIYNLLIVGALTAGFIPTFTKVLRGGADKTAAWHLANNVLNIIAITLFFLSGLGIIFTPQLIPFIFPGFPLDTQALAVQYTRIMFLSPILLGISMVLGGILQSLRQFVTYSLAPVFYNLGIIIGALVLVPMIGATGLAWGVVLGAALHLAVQALGAYHNGYRWQWKFDWRDRDTRTIGRLMVPRTIGLAITQINAIVVTAIASFLAVGSVSVYNFADNLQAVPVGLIAIPFALAVFPVLSQLSATENIVEFRAKISETMRKILFLIMPVMVAMLLLRAQIVRIVLGTGAFDWSATITTANALAFFSLGLLASALLPLLVRAFFALSDSRTPLLAAITCEIVTIGFSVILMKKMGVAGLTLASALGDMASAALLLMYLRRRLGGLNEHANLIFLYKIGVGGILMAITMQFLKYPLANWFSLDYFYGVLLQGGIAGTLGLLIYALSCYILRVREMTEYTQSFRKKWLSLWNIKEGIDEAERL